MVYVAYNVLIKNGKQEGRKYRNNTGRTRAEALKNANLINRAFNKGKTSKNFRAKVHSVVRRSR